MVAVIVALVMGSAARSAVAAPAAPGARPSLEQVTTLPAPTGASTATTALSAPTQLAPVTPTASLEKAKVTNTGRRVLLLVVALGLVAAFVIAFTVWFWRATVPTPEVLRPLESLQPRRGSKSES